MDAKLNFKNCIDLQMKSADAIPPCIIDINNEKECSKTLESTDEVVESLKSEGVLTVSFICISYCRPLVDVKYTISKVVAGNKCVLESFDF